ncbi:GNAT family N-acetyltransferase [Anoxybacillus sp. TBDG-1]
MYYKLVETAEEQKLFQRIYEQIWEEVGFQKEQSSPFSKKYLFFEEGKAVGTLELYPFDPQSPYSIEKDFSFSKHEKILEGLKKGKVIWEVDKVGILPAHRGKGFMELLVQFFIEHRKNYGLDLGIFLLEERFFRVLKKIYTEKILFSIGPSLIFEGERKKVVPSIVDLESLEALLHKNEVRV